MKPVLFTFCFLIFILVGCPSRSPAWTEQQKADFRKQCAAVDSTDYICVMFIGFRDEEFDSVLVREYADSILVDTFMLYVWPAQSPDQKQRLERGATIPAGLPLSHTYAFCTPTRKPFILSGMKMIMWSQYAGGENYGCVMGEYVLDGVQFHDDANPRFIK